MFVPSAFKCRLFLLYQLHFGHAELHGSDLHYFIISIVIAFLFIYLSHVPCKIALFGRFLMYIFLFTLLAFCGQ